MNADTTEGAGATLLRWLIWLRPIVSLLVVNALAMFGQVLFGIDNYTPADWAWPARLTVAIGAAVALESMALYVQWHAHDSLMRRATRTAARQRHTSYLIAAAVAAINYSHFAGPGWEPTPSAVMFAVCSLATPWLWGLHTRRAQNLQLIREGHADSTGAVFSAERWRMFPLRTWGALRFSIEHSIADPREAWVAYNTDRRTPAAHAEPDAEPQADEGPDQEKVSRPEPPRLVSLRPASKRTHRTAAKAVTDEEALASGRRWVKTHGRLPRTRAELRTATLTGGARAERFGEILRREQDQQSTGTDR